MKGTEVLRKDPKMRKLVDSIPPSQLHIPGQKQDLREYLVGSILSQQLSVKVARVIHDRFLNLYGGRFPANQDIINSPVETLRNIGLSNQKTNYVKNIAIFFEEHPMQTRDWQSLSDEVVKEKLTSIKGVGQWTAEMVLMFGLCREDVFSPGDYGIQVAMKKLYKLDLEGRALQQKMIQQAERWRPFRSLACFYLWAWKDSV